MEWRISSEGTTARYGFEPGRGVYVSTVHNDVLVAFDANDDDFDTDRPLGSILALLSQFGLLTSDAIDEALDWTDNRKSHGETYPLAPPRGWPGRARRPPRRLRRVLQVIANLRAAGA